MTFGDTVTMDGAVKGLGALGADLSSRGFMTAVMQGGGPAQQRGYFSVGGLHVKIVPVASGVSALPDLVERVSGYR